MEIRTEAHGPYVVVVTVDNLPRLNAMTRAMMADLTWDRLVPRYEQALQDVVDGSTPALAWTP